MSPPLQDIQAIFAHAVRHFQAGQLTEAEKLGRTVLSAAPSHVDSMHLLGLIAYQQQRLGEAVRLLENAQRLRPNTPAILGVYGHALCATGRFDEALGAAERLIRLNPADSSAWILLALASSGVGRTEEALENFNKALSLKPDSAEAFFRRGCLFRTLKRPAEAAGDFDRALKIHPRLAEAHLNKGLLFLEESRAEEALACFDKAIDLRPNYAVAHNNKGNALLALQKARKAVESYARAIEIDANLAEAYNNKGNALKALGLPADALLDYDRAIALRPDYAMAWCNKGNALQALERSEDALFCYRQAIGLDPDCADAYANRAVALSILGRNQEAVDDYRTLTRLHPGDAQSHYDLAVTLLRMEQFIEGLPLFEWRKKLPRAMNFRAGPQPLWSGQQAIAGQILLVDAEQGLGDTIQFCRYVPQLERAGAKIVLSVQDGLVRLLRHSYPDVSIIGASDAPAQFDYHVPLLSLPLTLGIPEAPPTEVPYLFAEPELVATWKARLGGGKFKIGIGWQGNKDSPADIGRSLAVTYFREISEIPQISLMCLQKGYTAQQLSELSGGLRIDVPGHGFDEGRDAFVDTAAVMQNLDLIVTSDTAIAHLAGALGRPVWLALQYWPDWRWFLEKSHSPWYPTMRLFRQTRPGDWAGLFAQIKLALLDILAERRH
jgi:tetratricopeptide (TPR) repeat protein